MRREPLGRVLYRFLAATKRYEVNLNNEVMDELIETAISISNLKNSINIPAKNRTPVCNGCSNSEFCWGGGYG